MVCALGLCSGKLGSTPGIACSPEHMCEGHLRSVRNPVPLGVAQKQKGERNKIN